MEQKRSNWKDSYAQEVFCFVNAVLEEVIWCLSESREEF